MGKVVELRKGAPSPAIGDRPTWDGEGWVPQPTLTRRGVIGPRGLQEWLRLSTGMEGPDIDIDVDGCKIGRGGDTILLFHADGSPVSEFAATAVGLQAAHDAASSGGLIQVPIRTYTGTLTITTNNLTFIKTGFMRGTAGICKITDGGAAVVTSSASGIVWVGIDIVNTGTGAAFHRGLYLTGGTFMPMFAEISSVAETWGGAVVVEGADTFPRYCTFAGAAGVNLLSGLVEMSDCSCVALSGGGVGAIQVSGGVCVLQDGTLRNATGGPHLKQTGGSLYVHSVFASADDATYVPIALRTEGTITHVQGSRACYYVEDYHAADIEAATLTRHLPAPAGAGRAVRDTGAVWESTLTPTWQGVHTFPNVTLVNLTQGSVLFIGAAGAVTEDNTRLYFEDGNLALGDNAGMRNVFQAVKAESTTDLNTVKALVVARNTNTTSNNWAGFSWQTEDAAGAIVSGARLMTHFTSHAVGAVSGELVVDTRHAGTRAERVRVESDGKVTLTERLTVPVIKSTVPASLMFAWMGV